MSNNYLSIKLGTQTGGNSNIVIDNLNNSYANIYKTGSNSGQSVTLHGTGIIASGSATTDINQPFIVNGDEAVAIGSGVQANQSRARAYGYKSIANNFNSVADGIFVTADGPQQHVWGKYNVTSSTLAFILGNGTADNARSNAVTVDWTGNVVAAGTVQGTNLTEGGITVFTTANISYAAVLSCINKGGIPLYYNTSNSRYYPFMGSKPAAGSFLAQVMFGNMIYRTTSLLIEGLVIYSDETSETVSKNIALT